jgi:DNA-binding GntR family transcriptional regulator
MPAGNGAPRTKDPGVSTVRGPASEPVYTRIQEMIMALELEPGERLTVEALARDLDVSATPIREAVARLESEGLVTRTQWRGYRVSDQQTRAQFDQMFETRLLLEPRMARNAARRATDEQKTELQELSHLIDRTGEASRGSGTYHEFARLDAQFHRLIAVAAGNVLVADMLDRLHVHLHLFRLRRDQGVADQALAEHQLIVDFITAGNDELAAAAMLSHIDRSLSRVHEAYNKGEG